MCTSRRPEPRRGWSAVALVALALLAACGRRESAVEAGLRTQTLEVGILGEPSELDPHIINSPPDFRVVPALFEGLVVGNPTTLEPEPGVAERWELSPDRLTYTFHLRRDARWSNGDPVTAADFLTSFRRALTPELGSPYTFLFSAVRGADAFAAGRLHDFTQVGLAAPDPHTVQITLRQPTPYFLAIIANNPVWYPIHPPTLERAGDLLRRGSGWTRPEHFVGNGAFVLTEWRPNRVITARRSPTYWNSRDVRLRAIHFRPFDQSEAEERAFRAGQLHVTIRLPPQKAAAYRERDPSPLSDVPYLMVRFVNVNTSRAPLDDARVRRALALALDRLQLADRVYRGAATPAFTVIPGGMPGYEPAERLVEGLAAARELLAEAGFPEGRGVPPIELQVEASAGHELDQALQAAWREGLGLDVRIVRSEPRVHWSNLHQRNYQLSIGGWVADYPDATAFLDLWARDSGWNFTGWTDPAYDAALTRAAAAAGADERLGHLQAAEARLLAAMPVIPVWFERNLKLIHPTVRGWGSNVMDRPSYRTVFLQK